MGKPLVTAVNGAAAGAGFSLAILGDIALAARSAQFALAYGGIGLSPDGGSTWLLPRLVGLRRAQELALTNKRLTAEERSEEHTSELQSLMRISYAVFCLKKKNKSVQP